MSFLKLFFFAIIFFALGVKAAFSQPTTSNTYFDVKSAPIKLTEFTQADFSKYASNVPNSVKPTKQPPQKTYSDSLLAAIMRLTDSLATAKIQKIPFDCHNPEASKPRTLGSLNQIDNRVFDVTSSANLNLSLFGIASGSLGKNDILIQANFFVFKDYSCPDGTISRALVGMTLYLHVSSLSMKLSVNSLPNISAAVQLSKASASYSLQFFGLTSAINFGDLPSIGDLSVDNYSKIISAWDKIKDALNKNSEVDPVIITNYKVN